MLFKNSTCDDCGAHRGFLARLSAMDDCLCDECYFKFVKSVRIYYEKGDDVLTTSEIADEIIDKYQSVKK